MYNENFSKELILFFDIVKSKKGKLSPVSMLSLRLPKEFFKLSSSELFFTHKPKSSINL